MTSEARREGWYRCTFCGTANALPWSEMEAQDGPASAIVLLRRGKMLHFVIPAGTLFFGFEAGFLAFALASVSAMAVGVLELHGMGPPSILLVVAAALCGSYWGLRRHLSQQHLELEGATLRWYRSFRGRQLGLVERSMANGLPAAGSEANAGRYRVRLFPRDRPLDLLCSGPREGKWLEAHLAAAVAEQAPVSVSMERHLGQHPADPAQPHPRAEDPLDPRRSRRPLAQSQHPGGAAPAPDRPGPRGELR